MAFALLREPLYYAPRALLALTLIFSVLRFRLWDIDFVINRSLVYGTLTLFLIGIFGLTIYLLSLFTRGENAILPIAMAAVVAGASFQPVRTQLKRLVDKKLYRIQIDYQRHAAPRNLTSANFVQAGLGKYQNMELVGRGGMAEVYRATHPTLNMPVALKILAPQLSSQANFRRRFEREAQIMSGLEHPNIARVFDYGVENGTHYIVMEYVNGQDLGRLLKTQKCFPLQDTLSILEPIASALDYAHKGGLVHRDVKPSNILIEKETNRPVLMDFGIAKLTNQTTLTGTGGMVGTLDYIAPEQIQAAENIDGRADIYSLSVLAYQLLTGELPFSRQNAGALLMAHLTQPPPDARIALPGLSSATAHALMRGMSKRPADRPASACELVSMLS
jgi:serine/threonine protein kinase